MGSLYETIRVRNVLVGGEHLDLFMKIDTGALLPVLPGWLQERLRFPLIRTERVRYANEETAQRSVVYGVELTVCERTGVFEAIVEPAKEYGLLGAIVLETLDLIVEPRSQKLYPNPRSPDMPMTEIETLEAGQTLP